MSDEEKAVNVSTKFQKKRRINETIKTQRAEVLNELFNNTKIGNPTDLINILLNKDKAALNGQSLYNDSDNSIAEKIYKKYGGRVKVILTADNISQFLQNNAQNYNVETFKKNFPFGLELWIHPEIEHNKDRSADPTVNWAKVPVLEDFALKRVISIKNSAAKFINTTQLAVEESNKLNNDLQEKYKAFLQEIINNLDEFEDYAAQQAKIAKLIKQFYEDACAIACVAAQAVDAAAVKSVVKQFDKNEQEFTPDYAKRDILTINLATDRFEHYRRHYTATKDQRDQMRSDDTGEISPISSHNRSGELVPNYAAYSFGSLNVQSNQDGSVKSMSAQVNHIGARHGTLPPIDLYKRKDKTAHDIRRITYRNAKQLLELQAKEIAGAVSKENPIDLSNITFTHRYTHLISPAQPNEHQSEQFRDTRLVYYALREPQEFDINGKKVSMKLAYDCYGVNFFRKFPNYQQSIVNDIDFIDLYEDVLAIFNTDSDIKVEKHYNPNNYKRELNNLHEFAEDYFASFDFLELDNKELKIKIKKIDKQEIKVAKLAEDYIEAVNSTFENKAQVINKKIKDLVSNGENAKAGILSGFYLIQKMRASGLWKHNKYNGAVQSLLGLVTELMGDHYSEGCKSGTDRTLYIMLVLAELADQVSKNNSVIDEHMLEGMATALNRVYASSASHIQAAFDNRGMPSKFDGTGIGKVKENKNYAKLGKLSAHKQNSEATKSSVLKKIVHKVADVLKKLQITIVNPIKLVIKKRFEAPSPNVLVATGHLNNPIKQHDIRKLVYDTIGAYGQGTTMFAARGENKHVSKFKQVTQKLDINTDEGRNKFIAYLWQHYFTFSNTGSQLKSLYRASLEKVLQLQNPEFKLPEGADVEQINQVFLKELTEKGIIGIGKVEPGSKEDKFAATAREYIVNLYKTIDTLLTTNSYNVGNTANTDKQIDAIYDVIESIIDVYHCCVREPKQKISEILAILENVAHGPVKEDEALSAIKPSTERYLQALKFALGPDHKLSMDMGH